MSRTRTRIPVVAALLGALSIPALAADEAPVAKQDCSVCDDPTWPELRAPLPAIVLSADATTEIAAVQLDPTWPEIRDTAPAIILGPGIDGELADVLRDPTWPAIATVAPGLQVNGHRASGDVAHGDRAAGGSGSGSGQ